MNDRAQPDGAAPRDAVSDRGPRQRMRRLRKHLLPLKSESMSPIDLPSVRTGLLTKLNSLTVGLISLTALAISAYYFWQQWTSESSELRQRGRTIAAVFAEQSEFGVVHVRPRVARADAGEPRARPRHRVRDRAGPQAVADRRATLLRSLGNVPVPALPANSTMPARGQMLELEPTIAAGAISSWWHRSGSRHRALRERSRMLPQRPRRARRPTRIADRLPAARHVVRAPARGDAAQALGTLTVVLLLTVVAVIASLLLTRRLVAPMRRLMRAARAVGAGARRLRAGDDRPTSWACSRTRSIT